MRLYLLVPIGLLIGSIVDDTHASVFINSYEYHDYREFFFKIAQHFSYAPKFQNNKLQYAVIIILPRNARYSYHGSTRDGWIYYPTRYMYHYTHDTERAFSNREYCTDATNAKCLYPDRTSTTVLSAPPDNRIGNYFVVNTGTSTTDGLTTEMIGNLLGDKIMKIMHKEWLTGDYPDIMMYTEFIPNADDVVTLLQQRLAAWSWNWNSQRVCVYYTVHNNYLKSPDKLTTADDRRVYNLQGSGYKKINPGVVTTGDYYTDFYKQIHAEFKTSRKSGHSQFAVMIFMDPTFRNDWIRNPKGYLYSYSTDKRTTAVYGTDRLEQADKTTARPQFVKLGNYAVYNLKKTTERNLNGYDYSSGNWEHSEHGLLRHYLNLLKKEFQRKYNINYVPEILIYTWIFPCRYCSQELINIFRPTTGFYTTAGVSIGYTTIGKYLPDVQIDEWRPKLYDEGILSFYIIKGVVDVNLGTSVKSGVCKLGNVRRRRRETFSNCDTAQTCMMECLRVNTECFRLCCCCEEDSTTAMVAYSVNSIYSQCHRQSASVDEKKTCWRNWLDRNIGSDCACASKSIITTEYTECLEAVNEEQYTIGPPLDEHGNTREGVSTDILRYMFIPSQCPESGRQGFLCTLDQDQDSTAEQTSSIRLVGGNAYYEGRVEAQNTQGAWGLICDDFFDLKDATVVCRQLNFAVAQEALTRSHFGSGSGNYILDDLGCRGTESSIFSCTNAGVGRSNCREGEAASVRCADFIGLDNDNDNDNNDNDGDDDNDDDDTDNVIYDNNDNNQDYMDIGQQPASTSQTDCSAFRAQITEDDNDNNNDNNDDNDNNNDNEPSSGIHEIGPSTSRFQAYCDMETGSGGWTVIQRRQDGDDEFYKNWVEYEEGFGDLNGNHWLGLKHIYALTNSKTYRLRIDMTDFRGGSAYAEYRTFKIESASHECPYCLRLGEFSGGEAGDALADSDTFTYNGDSNVDQPFSTRDRLNAGSSYNSCVVTNKAGWWYSTGGLCGNANPNGKYYSSHSQSNYYPNDVIFWYTWKNDRSPLKTIEMKIYPTTVISSQAVGFNTYGN